jgi:hypothetical protein
VTSSCFRMVRPSLDLRSEAPSEGDPPPETRDGCGADPTALPGDVGEDCRPSLCCESGPRARSRAVQIQSERPGWAGRPFRFGLCQLDGEEGIFMRDGSSSGHGSGASDADQRRRPSHHQGRPLARERRVPSPPVLTPTGAGHAQDQVGIEPHPQKKRRPSNTRDSISRTGHAKEPLPRMDALSGAQRAPLGGHPAGPDVVGPVRPGIPSRAAHERTDRRPQHDHQEPWSEIHASSHRDAGTNGSGDPPLPLRGRPTAMSPAYSAPPHHEQSVLNRLRGRRGVGGPDLPAPLRDGPSNPLYDE